MDPLALALTVDPYAVYPSGQGAEGGCLLVTSEHAEAVMALFPGSWEEPNEPATTWTRVVYPAREES